LLNTLLKKVVVRYLKKPDQNGRKAKEVEGSWSNTSFYIYYILYYISLHDWCQEGMRKDRSNARNSREASKVSTKILSKDEGAQTRHHCDYIYFSIHNGK
jgi:hypothetical protein